MSGWIKVHRKVLRKCWFNKPDYVALWVHLLLEATHDEKEYFWNGKTVILKPGQFVTGRRKLSVNSGINESKVERVLKAFEIEQQIEQQKSNTSRLISICNWSQYQNGEQQNEQPVNNGRTTGEQQTNTKQEEKNDKKVKKKEGSGVFTPPSVQEIESYFFEKTNWDQEKIKKQAAKMWNLYESKGWMVGKNKMQKWKSAAAGWVERESDYTKKEHGSTAKEPRTGGVANSKIEGLFKSQIFD